jgi:signal transduction histidine kinase
MIAPKYLKPFGPVAVSILSVLGCFALRQLLIMGGPQIILKYPFFPYAPIVFAMGYLYGMPIGLFTFATSSAIIFESHPELVSDWYITLPVYALISWMGLWTIIRLKESSENERTQRLAQADFMAMLAHEIKNPLATLETSAYSLSLMANSDAAAERIRNHSQAIDDISNIVDRLLEVDSVENRKVRVAAARFQLKKLLFDITESASEPQRIQISCAIESTITNDPILIRRILINLTDNALKYSFAHKPIQLAAIPERRMSRMGITFRCTNPIGPLGAPNPSKVFTKYYRAPTATGVSGAGVGLWLCKQLVEAMSGEIQVEVTDQEVSFYVWLPDLSGEL